MTRLQNHATDEGAGGVSDKRLLSERAAGILKARRAREGLFGRDISVLFGEPAYDMLLNLYVAHCQGVRISVSSACYASGAPYTTALRILSSLEASSTIIREDNPADRRSRCVWLSAGAIASVEQHLRAMCD